MGRKALSTVWVIGGGLAMIFGIVVDAPQAISTFVEQGPTWLRDPDARWVVAIAIAVVAALVAIWSGPESEGIEALDPNVRAILKTPNRLRRVTELMSSIAAYLRNYRDEPDYRYKEAVVGRLKVYYLPIVRKALGDDAAREFEDTLKGLEKGRLYLLCDVMKALVNDQCIERLEELAGENKQAESSVVDLNLALPGFSIDKLESVTASPLPPQINDSQ